MICPCCGLEIEAEDIDLCLEFRPTFDGYCRDCTPNGCAVCD